MQHTDEIKGKLREKVENAVEDIKMSKFLATIRIDVPIDFNAEEFRLVEPDREKLRKLFLDLEFKTLADKILNKVENKPKTVSKQLDLFAENPDDSQETPKNVDFLTLKTTPHDYKLIENQEDMIKLCDFFRTNKILSLDTETTSTNAIDAELVGLSFSVKEFEAFYIPIPANREEAQKIVNIFKPVYEDPNILKVGQNLKYDLEVLRNYDIHLAGKMWDTMIAHYLIQPELRHILP